MAHTEEEQLLVSRYADTKVDDRQSRVCAWLTLRAVCTGAGRVNAFLWLLPQNPRADENWVGNIGDGVLMGSLMACGGSLISGCLVLIICLPLMSSMFTSSSSQSFMQEHTIASRCIREHLTSQEKAWSMTAVAQGKSSPWPMKQACCKAS